MSRDVNYKLLNQCVLANDLEKFEKVLEFTPDWLANKFEARNLAEYIVLNDFFDFGIKLIERSGLKQSVNSPLSVAIELNKYDALSIFMDKCKVYEINECNIAKYAICNADLKAIKILVNKNNVNIVDEFNRHCLFYLKDRDDFIEINEYLGQLNIRYDLLDYGCNDFYLHASYYNNIEFLEYFYKYAKVNAVNKKNESSLFVNFKSKRYQLCDKLLSFGFKPITGSGGRICDMVIFALDKLLRYKNQSDIQNEILSKLVNKILDNLDEFELDLQLQQLKKIGYLEQLNSILEGKIISLCSDSSEIKEEINYKKTKSGRL